MTRNKPNRPVRWPDGILPSAPRSAPRELRINQRSPRQAAISLALTVSVIVPWYATAADLIAFQSDRNGDAEMIIMDPDGSNQRQLTDNDAQDYSPRWSPDGSKIIFVSDRDGNDEIYRMNADGTGVTRLTHYDKVIREFCSARVPAGDGPTSIDLPTKPRLSAP